MSLQGEPHDDDALMLCCILTPQKGSRGWCVTTLNSVTLGRFIAWPIEPSLGAVRQPKKTGGHHLKNIYNFIYSRVAPWPQTPSHADATGARFVRAPRCSPRPETGLVCTWTCVWMVPAIGLRRNRPQRVCNGILVRLKAPLREAPGAMRCDGLKSGPGRWYVASSLR